MKKDLALIGGLFLVVVALLLFGGGFSSIGFNKQFGASGSATPSGAVSVSNQVRIKNLSVSVQIADNKEERSKGLSKLENILINEGMLFVFEKEEPVAIWMKDMRFPIDIIWLSQDKKVVDIAYSVAPEPQKKDRDLTIYRSKSPAKFVLEVNAGLSSLNDVQIGDQAEF